MEPIWASIEVMKERRNMYRILTENKQKPEILNTLIGLGLDFTTYEADGTWQGKHERSLVIELEEKSLTKVLKAASLIRKLNNQESVFVQEIPTKLISVEETCSRVM